MRRFHAWECKKRLVLSLLLLGLSPARAQESVTVTPDIIVDLNLSGSVLSDGSLFEANHFQNLPGLCVQACQQACPETCVSQDIFGNQESVLIGDKQWRVGDQFIAGVTVRRDVAAIDASEMVGGGDTSLGLIRYLDQFENNTPDPKTIQVSLGAVNEGRFLGNAFTEVRRTQHFDDTELESLDRWALYDNSADAAPVGPRGIVYWGGGGTAPTSNGVLNAPQGLQPLWRYVLEIPPESTRSIMTLLIIGDDYQDTLLSIQQSLKIDPAFILAGLPADIGATVANFGIDPSNYAPLALVGGPYRCDEGESLTIEGGGSYDPDGSTSDLTYGWHLSADVPDGSPFDAQESSVQMSFDDQGEYVVRLTVTDLGNLTDITYSRILVNNVAPSILGFNTTSPIGTTDPIGEGEYLEAQVTASDQGGDTLSYAFDWLGNAVFEDTDGPSGRHLYRQDGTYTVRVRVDDGDGGVTIGEESIFVENLSPKILPLISPSVVGEGQIFPVTVFATDPGQDPMTYSLDLDNDGFFELTQNSNPTFDVVFPESGDGFLSFKGRACDDQDACDEIEHSISVANLPPQILSMTVPELVTEGQPFTIDVVAADTPEDYENLLYAFDFNFDGDFRPEDEVSTPQKEHVFAKAGQYQIGVRVSDQDGGISTSSVWVTVENSPPQAELIGPDRLQEGEIGRFTCDGVDSGNRYLVTDWDVDNNAVYELVNTPRTVSLDFADEGNYLVNCRLRDGLGGIGSAQTRVLVSNVAPTARIIAPASVQEGAEVLIRIEASDPGSDVLTYQFDLNSDGIPDGPPAESLSVTHVFAAHGVYEVTAWVSDQTDVTEVSQTIVVENKPPVVSLIAPALANEGEAIRFEVDAFDSSSAVTLAWDFEDDGVVDLYESEPLGAREVERFHTLPDNGHYSVKVIAIDDSGAEASAVTTVVVSNLPPSLFDGFMPLPATEGQVYNRVIPVSDPAGAYDPLRFSLIGAPSHIQIDERFGLLNWTPTYDDVLSAPIFLRLRVVDDDNASFETTLSFTVIPQDDDNDGIPDSFESATCSTMGVCLDPANPDDAQADFDGDGLSNFQEWAQGSGVHDFDGPTPPRLLAPADGVRVAESRPTFEIEVEENSDLVEFECEFYETEAAEQIVATHEGEIDSQGRLTWQFNDRSFAEDQMHWWRCRVRTSLAQSDWSGLFSFLQNAENSPPPAPELLTPSDESRLGELMPLFTARPVSDPDGDELRYLFRFFQPNGELETLGYGEMEDGFVQFRRSFREGVTLLWEVVAVDEVGALSESSGLRAFTIDAINSAPEMPEILSPSDRGQHDQNPVEIELGPLFDADEDAIFVDIELSHTPGEVAHQQRFEGLIEGGVYRTDAELDEDRFYELVVTLEDDEGVRSSSALNRFFLSSADDPPSTPVPNSPPSGTLLTPEQVVLVWTLSVDPENRPVTYSGTVCPMLENDTPDDSACTTFGSLTENGVDFRAKDWLSGRYEWRVWAEDDAGNQSSESEPWTFEIIAQDIETGCDCRIAINEGSKVYMLWFIGVGLILRRRQLH